MGFDTTTGSDALKELYLGTVREQINTKVFMLTQIEAGPKEDIEGSEAVLSLHVSRNSGVGSRAEHGDLPTAGNQGYKKERVGLKSHYGRILVSGRVMRATKSNEGSFVRAVESEIKGAVTDLRSDLNRQIFGTSDGVLAATTAAGPTNTITFAAGTTDVQKRHIFVGMPVDLGDASPYTSVATNRTVTAVTANTFTISGAAVTTTINTRVVRQGNGGSGAAQVELTGLRTIVSSTGTLFNVDPTVYPSWKATETAVGGAISENILEKLLHDVSIAGPGEPNLIVSSHGVQRAYSNLLTSLKRFTNTMDLKGGYKALEINAGEQGIVGWKVDKDAPESTVLALDTTHIYKHQSCDWEWMDDDGAVLSRVAGKEDYEATLYSEFELTTDERNAHGILTGVTAA